MALRKITINGQPILVEVADLKVEGNLAGDGFEETAGISRSSDDDFEDTSVTDRLADVKDRLEPLLAVIGAPVRAVCEAAGAAEWSVEVSIGFAGKAGIPFLASGEANAALKVTAKWKQED